MLLHLEVAIASWNSEIFRIVKFSSTNDVHDVVFVPFYFLSKLVFSLLAFIGSGVVGFRYFQSSLKLLSFLKVPLD